MSAWRELGGAARAEVLVIGWGDAEFYRRNVNPWTTIAAIFWPTPSVLHIVPVRGSLIARFPHSDVVEFALTPAKFRALVTSLDRSFTRDARGRRIDLGRGYYPESRIYAGRESFYFPKMCNLWAAQHLRRAGVPFFLPTTLTAGGLIRQAAQTGVRQQRRSRPADAF